MRTRSFLAAASFAGLVTGVGAASADKVDWTGKVKWAEKQPKVYPAEKGERAGVEVLGEYEVPKGWEAKTVVFHYIPKEGGTPKEVKEEFKLDGGKFGAIDPKTKKVVPLKVPLDPGEWTVRVMIAYERTENGQVADEISVQTPWKNVEVK